MRLNQVDFSPAFASSCGAVLAVWVQSCEQERRLRADLELRTQRLTLELAHTKQHIQEGDYRRDNYPRIQRFVWV